MWNHRHGVHADGDDDLGVTGRDLLHAERDRTKARTAALIHSPGGGLPGNAGLHGRLTGGVLAFSSREDLTKDHLVYFDSIDTCTIMDAADNGGSQLVGRNVRERAVELLN
ncbi:hypothetical protein ASG54_10650 [Aureimonas sp. Leaf460]|nr:hypothetical protein ASG62_08055 [Aureimonas sp. Leaf427]KQT79454.1 hypothetical protein ASG54_10650 [Aureimonas sp. Leaf460]